MSKRTLLLALTIATVAAATMGAQPRACVPVEPEGPVCEALDPHAYGDCEMVLGVVFDGTSCVTASGCSCGDDCALFFDDAAACREACGLPDVAGEGDVCGQSAGGLECAEGLVCCYPCGIQGCDFRCTTPCDAAEPWCAGGCPMLP